MLIKNVIIIIINLFSENLVTCIKIIIKVDAKQCYWK